MSADKYPTVFLRQMEALSVMYIHPGLKCSLWVLQESRTVSSAVNLVPISCLFRVLRASGFQGCYLNLGNGFSDSAENTYFVIGCYDVSRNVISDE